MSVLGGSLLTFVMVVGSSVPAVAQPTPAARTITTSVEKPMRYAGRTLRIFGGASGGQVSGYALSKANSRQ
jgi:hypothetical protein